jgi:hypothetical protein
MQDLQTVKQVIEQSETAVSSLLDIVSNNQQRLSDLQSTVLRGEWSILSDLFQFICGVG